jgi:hypothetical protein
MTDHAAARVAARERLDHYVAALGEAMEIDLDESPPEGSQPIDIAVFERVVVADELESEDAEIEEIGVVLVTNGMSDRLLPVPSQARRAGASPRVELIWAVDQPTDEVIAFLRWLARWPEHGSDNAGRWVGDGHLLALDAPPITGCRARHVLLLAPVFEPDVEAFDGLEMGRDAVQGLCVHLVSDAEAALIAKDRGLERFLDLLDEKGYPMFFDPARPSYV